MLRDLESRQSSSLAVQGGVLESIGPVGSVSESRLESWRNVFLFGILLSVSAISGYLFFPDTPTVISPVIAYTGQGKNIQHAVIDTSNGSSVSAVHDEASKIAVSESTNHQTAKGIISAKPATLKLSRNLSLQTVSSIKHNNFDVVDEPVVKPAQLFRNAGSRDNKVNTVSITETEKAAELPVVSPVVSRQPRQEISAIKRLSTPQTKEQLAVDYYQQGSRLFESGNINAAQQHVLRAVELDPAFALWHFTTLIGVQFEFCIVFRGNQFGQDEGNPNGHCFIKPWLQHRNCDEKV